MCIQDFKVTVVFVCTTVAWRTPYEKIITLSFSKDLVLVLLEKKQQQIIIPINFFFFLSART